MVRCMLWCRHGVDLRDCKRRRRAGAGAEGGGLAQEQQQQRDKGQQGVQDQGAQGREQEHEAAGSGEEEGGQEGGAGGRGKGKAPRPPRWKPCGCPHYLRLTVGVKAPNEVVVSGADVACGERLTVGTRCSVGCAGRAPCGLCANAAYRISRRSAGMLAF